MANETPPPPSPGEERERLEPLREHAWYEWVGLVFWAGAILFWVQFAIASHRELEPQAAFLGWTIVTVLLVGGFALWGAYRHSRRHPLD